MQLTQVDNFRSATEAAGAPDCDSNVEYGFLRHALAHWMETDAGARVLVDNQLHAWWVSPAADAVLAETSALVLRNGFIRTRENRFERQLREMVDNATREVTIQCIYDQRTEEHIVLTAQRLNAPSDHLIGITLQRANEDFVFRLADLRDAFGFTRTEGRVAYHLMCGLTAEETSRHLQVSLETVRTHIKRAYAKLGVSSREAFFHRLTPFIVVFA